MRTVLRWTHLPVGWLISVFVYTPMRAALAGSRKARRQSTQRSGERPSKVGTVEAAIRGTAHGTSSRSEAVSAC